MSSSSTTSAATDSTTAINDNSNNYNNQTQQQPETFEEAITTLEQAEAKILELRAKRDKLQAQLDRDKKTVEKLQKNTRLAELKSLVPRQLFRTEDKYNEELEKVYSWQGICDKDIADMYQAKLRSIDLGGQKRERTMSQHGASITTTRDPYANFREVPDFYSNNSNNNKNNAIRNYELFKRIAGSDIYNNNNSNGNNDYYQ
jgi:DNA repair ATPase RecN